MVLLANYIHVQLSWFCILSTKCKCLGIFSAKKFKNGPCRFICCLNYCHHVLYLTYLKLVVDSGGRDLSGNKRTNKEQSFDQKFEKLNEALKVSCLKGYPVRVVRYILSPNPWSQNVCNSGTLISQHAYTINIFIG